MTMGKTFQNKTYRESCADYKSVRKTDLDAYSARKTQKTLLNATLLRIFNLKQPYLNKE